MKGVWMDAEVECRLCKRKCSEDITGLCLDCEEEFKRSSTRYVDFPYGEEIKPTPPLKIVKVAAKNRAVEDNTNSLLPLNSVPKSTKLGSIFDRDPGPPPTIPLPKLPIKDVKVQVGENDENLQIRTPAHRARVVEASAHRSQEALVQSVGETVRSLRTKGRVVERKKLETMPTGQYDMWQAPDLRVAYNNTTATSPSDEVTRKDTSKETVPDIKGCGNSGGGERPGSLVRGAGNRRRTNSCGEGIKREEEKARRDTSFYSFYDEILEGAKEKPARMREARG